MQVRSLPSAPFNGGNMKAKLKEEEAEGFKPVTIEITFETEKEMKDFKTIFNYTPVCDYFANVNIDYGVIRCAIPCDDHDDFHFFVGRVKGK